MELINIMATSSMEYRQHYQYETTSTTNTTVSNTNNSNSINGPTRPAKSANTWGVSLSPAGSTGSSDNDGNIPTTINNEIYPWSNELRQIFRYRYQQHHHQQNNNNNNSSEDDLLPTEVAQINANATITTVSSSRKRKIWDDLENLEVKSLPGQLECVEALQQLQESARSISHSDTLHQLTNNTISSVTNENNIKTLRNLKTRLSSNNKRSQNEQGSAGRMSAWHDIDDNLAADLDGSLSGLGEDLSTASYNMSEALLALPSLTVFKQEAPSPTNQNDTSVLRRTSPATDMDGQIREDSPSNLHNLLHHHVQNHHHHHQHQQQHTSGYHSPTNENGTSDDHHLHHRNAVINNDNGSYHDRIDKINETITAEDYRFQYVLAAATSIATKINEETLTYLNQGQSYEIKLKKLGDLTAYRGKTLKTVIRICFHERRLQYMEREKLAAWRLSRPGDRIVEVDIPLSYGIWDVLQDPAQLNAIEFYWDPTKEVGVYLKVNCISTEFTPKKHGGEKGVPFRIQVETYLTGDQPRRLHAAVCQIKVFKLKGADRKHKQDREKILKRPISEQEKYQPSYDCTILTDIPADSAISYNSTCVNGIGAGGFTPPENHRGGGTPTSFTKEENSPSAVPTVGVISGHSNTSITNNTDFIEEMLPFSDPLLSDANAAQTAQWLQNNRFGHFLHTFTSFTASDLLRLTKDDLIQICGIPDGIRLYNTLHAKAVLPRLTVYLRLEGTDVYQAIYLTTLHTTEMMNQIARTLNIPIHSIADIYLLGPAGIHVLVTDQVIYNLKDDSTFIVEIMQNLSGEHPYRVLLKSVTHNQM